MTAAQVSCGVLSAGGKGAAQATYRTEQRDKTVTIFADGTNSSGGWKNALTQLPMDIFPPEFKFVQTRPSGPSIQVITPFAVRATFEAGTPVQNVFVTDAGGRHKVAVKNVP